MRDLDQGFEEPDTGPSQQPDDNRCAAQHERLGRL
jgi:hypothetical protein